jgi:hypothetical protein
MKPETVILIRKWFYGLFSTAISAAANTVVVIIAAPETFNVDEGLGKLLSVTGVSFFFAIANYLKQSPLPAGTSVPPIPKV